MLQWLKYVPHHEFVVHLALGWVLSDDLAGTNHGAHAYLMVFAGEDEP
jgi:hypothetical protein